MPTDPALPEHPDYIDPSSDDLPAPHRAERRIRAYLTANSLDGILDAAEPGDGHPRPLYRRDLHALINHSRWVSDALQLCETQLAASHDATRRAVVTAHDIQQRLDKAIAALSEYFKGAAIGPDIAPRITEMRSDLMARAHAAERARDNAYAEREQLRYERRLLDAARLTLDLVAAGDESRWPQARREAQDLAQRLVDEIGHPVTDDRASAELIPAATQTTEPAADEQITTPAVAAWASLNAEISDRAEAAEQRITAAHEALAALDIDDDSCATLESTVEKVVASWQAIADSEAAAADQIEDLRRQLATTEQRLRLARATPGPQDIPDQWLTVLTRAADHEHHAGLGMLDVLRDAIRGAYRVGYAAHAGCEITVSAEDDLVLIGDRVSPSTPVPAAPASETEWSIRWPSGDIDRARTYAEAGARRYAAELGAEVVTRVVGPWVSAPPAVDPAAAPTAPAEGDRTVGDDHGPHSAWSYFDSAWSHVDADGDQIHIGDRAGQDMIIRTRHDCILMTPAAAIGLHTWLGEQLGHPDEQDDEQDHSAIRCTHGATDCCADHTTLPSLTMQALDQARHDYAQAEDDEERADVIGDLLADWYAAWPSTAATDPHQPIAAEILRIVGAEDDSSTPDPATRVIALGAAARLMAGAQLDYPDALVRDLEQITIGMANRWAEWIATGDYDWTTAGPEPERTTDDAVARRLLTRDLTHARAELGQLRPVVDAARAWRARITSDPNNWADDTDFALIAAVDAVGGR